MGGALIREPERWIPVDAAYDVIVVGGGIAGVAAALASARQGVGVALLERQFGLGGLATLGNVIMYLPLCDGYGRQVMGGIAEELIHRSVAELKAPAPATSFLPVPECWLGQGSPPDQNSKRFLTGFNPYAFQMELERLLEAAGITILYDTRACGVVKSGRLLSHILVENKSGRLALQGRQFIDASGDADLCHFAGCPTEEFPYNVLAGWYYEIHNGALQINKFTNRYDKQHRGVEAVGPLYSGVDHRQLTRQILDSRRAIHERIEEKRKKHPEDTIYPFGLPSIPDVRVTRRLLNRFSIGEQHDHTWLEDCVGITGDWRRRGPVYPIPLRAIQADTVPNLFVAGRCLSADHTVIDVTRAIGTCAVSGEACGVAAGILAKDKREDGIVPVTQLQRALIRSGALIDPELLKPAAGAAAVM